MAGRAAALRARQPYAVRYGRADLLPAATPPGRPAFIAFLNGSCPFVCRCATKGDELAPRSGHGRLPLCLSNGQPRGHDAGSLVEIVHSGSHGRPASGARVLGGAEEPLLARHIRYDVSPIRVTARPAPTASRVGKGGARAACDGIVTRLQLRGTGSLRL